MGWADGLLAGTASRHHGAGMWMQEGKRTDFNEEEDLRKEEHE